MSVLIILRLFARIVLVCIYCFLVLTDLLLRLRFRHGRSFALWLRRCQGSLLQDVICINRDCPIFYRRAKVKKEVGALQETLQRLHLTNDW